MGDTITLQTQTLQFPKSLTIPCKLQDWSEGQRVTCTIKQTWGTCWDPAQLLPFPFSSRAPSCFFPLWDKFLGITGISSHNREYPSVPYKPTLSVPRSQGRGDSAGPSTPSQSIRDANALCKVLLQMFLIKPAHPEPTRSNHPPKTPSCSQMFPITACRNIIFVGANHLLNKPPVK